MLSRFHTIPACHEQTDGQTDGRTDIAISISRVSLLTRDKIANTAITDQIILNIDGLGARVTNVRVLSLIQQSSNFSFWTKDYGRKRDTT